MNDIDERRIENIKPTFQKARGQVEAGIDSLATMDDIVALIRERIGEVDPRALAVEPEMTDASILIGVAFGRLQNSGASIAICHDLLDVIDDSPPRTHDIEYRPYGSGACHIIEGLHAEKLWRYGRMLYLGVFEMYVLLRGIDPVDETKELELWNIAVRVTKVIVDVYWPLSA